MDVSSSPCYLACLAANVYVYILEGKIPEDLKKINGICLKKLRSHHIRHQGTGEDGIRRPDTASIGCSLYRHQNLGDNLLGFYLAGIVWEDLADKP